MTSLFLTFLLFFTTLCIPGYLLSLILLNGRRFEFFSSLSVVISFGIVFYIPIFLLAYLLKLSWSSFAFIFVVQLVLILFIFIYKKPSFFVSFIECPNRFDVWSILISFIVSLYMFLHGGHFIGDATFHLASVLKLSENDIITPYAPMFKGVNEVTFVYAYNIWYGILAFIVRLKIVTLNNLWDFGPSFFTFYLFSGVYFLSNRLFQNKLAGLLSIISFFLYEWLSFGKTAAFADFKSLPYPDQIARNGLLLVALGLMLENAKLKICGLRYISSIVFIVIGMALTHMYSYAVFFVIGGTFLLGVLLFDSEYNYKKNIFIILITSFLVSLPVLWIRLGLSNYKIMSLSRSLKYVRFLESSYSVWGQGLSFFLLILVIVVLVFFVVKFVAAYFRQQGRVLIFMLSLPLVYFVVRVREVNVFISYLISSTYARRMASVTFEYLIYAACAYYIFVVINNSILNNYFKRIFNKACLFCVLSVLLFASFNLYKFYIKNDVYNRAYVMRETNIYTYINDNIPKWQVFLSHGHPSLELASQVPQYIVGGVGTHVPPVYDTLQRKKHLLELFSFEIPLSDYMRLVDYYDCSYLMLAPNQDTKNIFYHGTIIGGKSARYSSEKANMFIQQNASVFTEIYRDDVYALYKINRD